MRKTFADRLAALEALEVEAQPVGRFLDVSLYLQPRDYFMLFEDTTATEEERTRIWRAYGLDLLRDDDRVAIHGGAWPSPSPLRPWGRTIHCYNAPDGTGCRIDEYDAENERQFPRFPPAGEPHIVIAVGPEIEAMRLGARCVVLREALSLLDAGVLYVRSFNAVYGDLHTSGGGQVRHCCWVAGAESGLMLDDPRWGPMDIVRHTLDDLHTQRGMPFCQSSAEASERLHSLLAEWEHINAEAI